MDPNLTTLSRDDFLENYYAVLFLWGILGVLGHLGEGAQCVGRELGVHVGLVSGKDESDVRVKVDLAAATAGNPVNTK